MIRRFALALLCACGGASGGAHPDGKNLVAPTTCAGSGQGEIDGHVGSSSFPQISAAVVERDGTIAKFVLTLQDTGNVCFNGNGANKLFIYLCTDSPGVGTIAIGSDNSCSGATGAAQLVGDSGAVGARSGQVTFASVGSDCYTGTFDIVMQTGDELAGDFGAFVCTT
jgi:hypothetical protein